MKKVLAIFLSALLICISLAPMGSAASDPGLATRVFNGSYEDTKKDAGVITKTTFTLVVKAPAVKKLTGVNLYFSFDPAVLSVASAGVGGSVDAEDNFNPFFNGLPVTGYKSGSNSEYAFGWVDGDGVSKNSARDLCYITFNVLDTTKTEATVSLYVDEFRTDDGDDANDIISTTRIENKVITFNFPENTPPATTEAGSGDEGEGGSTSASDINGLLQLIRDMLSGNNVTFADFADAIANLLGNAEISDIIEMLVDGNVDISDFFQNILGELGLDFGSFEDLLNKIIDFFKGLFDGDDDDKKPDTTVVNTTAASVNTDTTAAGSSSGSEETGDAGIALAATICVAASAAFVLTRKKKETV